MKNYELALVFSQQSTTADQEKLITVFKKQVEALEGQWEKADLWGKKDLAYPIKKQTNAVFYLANFQLESSKVSDFDAHLRRQEGLLRFLLTLKEPIADKPKILTNKQPVKGKSSKKVSHKGDKNGTKIVK